VSLGLPSNFADVYRFVQFAAGLRDQSRISVVEATFDIESCRVIRDGSYSLSRPSLTAQAYSSRPPVWWPTCRNVLRVEPGYRR
jgi:hypothetical protein